MARLHTAAQGQEASWPDIGSIATGLGRVKSKTQTIWGCFGVVFCDAQMFFFCRGLKKTTNQIKALFVSTSISSP